MQLWATDTPLQGHQLARVLLLSMPSSMHGQAHMPLLGDEKPGYKQQQHQITAPYKGCSAYWYPNLAQSRRLDMHSPNGCRAIKLIVTDSRKA